MKAVIIAGGKGTRLGPLTRDIPKPMIPVSGRPLLEHQVVLLKAHGITEIIFLTGHLSDVIEDHFGNGSKWGVNITYVVENSPLGTGGALALAHEYLATEREFLVLYGDLMLDMDLSALVDFHAKHNPFATLVVHPNDHPYDSDLVEMNKTGRVLTFHSKPHRKNWTYHNLVNAAVYVLSPGIFKYIDAKTFSDLGKDVFPQMVANEDVIGYRTTEYLKDMGSPDRLEKVEADITSGKVKRLSKENKQIAVFLDRDGVINRHRDYIKTPDELEIINGTASAIKKLNKLGLLAIVTTNQPVVARNLCSEGTLDEIHKKMETALGEKRVWLDDIFYCPHHPDGGFPEENKALKIKCNCRKPAAGMLIKAAEKYNIDLSKSYMVGDTWRDVGAGREVGAYCIGIKASKDSVGEFDQFNPDVLVSNLGEAIDFIVQDCNSRGLL